MLNLILSIWIIKKSYITDKNIFIDKYNKF